jgi:drug/metabolite transporter (DMT)-like permease
VEPTTLASVLGLSAALGYGVGDFVGGMLSRRIHFAVVSVTSGAAALVVMAVVVMLAAPATPEPSALLWGALAGTGMGLGSLALFRGLGRGRMGVVAPVSAVTAAAIPVIVGVVLGDRPAAIAWIGVALALPAIWLVSSHEGEADTAGPAGSRAGLTASVTDGLLAGAGFALLFIGLGLAGDASGLWPVLASEVSALAVMVIAVVPLLPAIERRRLAPVDLAGAATVGLLGAAASVAYFFATHAGLLSIVVVLTSLYPAVTVVLAIVITHEPVGRRQALGLALACVSIALIVLG